MQKKAWGLIIGMFLASACNKTIPDNPQTNKSISVGTFNIYWLNEKEKDSEFLSPGRNNDDYKAVAKVIDKSGADLLVLQEISSESALQQLVETLNSEYPAAGWSYKDKQGQVLRGKNSNGSVSNNQEVAVIYKKGPITITGKEHLFEIIPPPKDDSLREPLLLHVKVNGEKDKTDFDLIGVHFKAMGGGVNWRETKEKELQNFSNWFKTERKSTNEESDHSTWKDRKFDPDLLVVGDFNAPLVRQGDNNAVIAHDLLKTYILPLKLSSPIYPRSGNGRYTDTYFEQKFANVIDLVFFSADLYNLSDKRANVLGWESLFDLSKFRKVKRKEGTQMVDAETYLRISDHRPVTVLINQTDKN